MGSFPAPVTSPQLATLRTSGYWARALAVLNPNDIVFQAQAAESITTDPFIEFEWTNATVGSFSGSWEGLVCFISETTDLRAAKYRGRARLQAGASTFFIDRNATILNEDDFITVIRDIDLFSRIRDDTLIDGSVAWHALPPMLKDLPSCIVLYDADNNGTEDYTPVQVGIPVDAAATMIDTWAWDVSGDGAFSIDNPTLEHPTFTFEAGYHYLIRVIYEDDNGVSNYQISHVYVVTRTFGAPCLQSIVTGPVRGTLQDGWSSTLTAYAEVSTLLDRTHCAVFSVQRFGDNSSTPIVSNVLMNGRIRSSSIQTQGSAEAGRVQQVTFTVEGITAYMRRETVPNDIMRATSTPNEWGEIEAPTPYRMAVYAAWAYTTLTNICSFGVEDGEFQAWQIGGEPRGIDGGYISEVLKNILDPIKAAVNFAPDGALFLARTVSYITDRSAVDTIATLTLGDLIEYGVERDSSTTTSQVIAYGGSFNETTNTFDIYSAQSPSIIYLEGETRELTREILEANATIGDAAIELKDRASNHYGYENPKPLLSGQLFDSWAGVLIPTNFQRWNAILPASSNTSGIAYGTGDYWQLQSVDLTLNPDGTINTSFDAPAETSFDDAQSLAALLPNNLSNMNPVLPVLPNDFAFPTDPLENYPTDDPGLDDLQSLDPFTGMVAYTPFPPDVAADVALRAGNPRCKVLAVNFRNSTNAESTWTTVLSDDYMMTLTGFAKISNGEYSIGVNTATSGASGQASGVTVGVGSPVVIAASGTYTYSAFEPPIGPEGTSGTAPGVICPTCTLLSLIAKIGAAGDWFEVGAGLSFTAESAGELYFTVNDYPLAFGDNSGTLTVDIEADALFADWAYQWNVDAEDAPINVSLLSTNGLYIDNTEYTPVPLSVPFPPFDPAHRYTGMPFVGTGNSFLARMVLSSYVGVQSAYLNIQVCPLGVTP